MRDLRSTFVMTCLVRGIIAVSLLWQVLGHPGVPRTLQNTREWMLLLVNRDGHTVAAAPTCELGAVHRLMAGQRGMLLLIVPACAAFDADMRDGAAQASSFDMFTAPALEMPAVCTAVAWHEYAAPCRQGIPLRQWCYD